MSFHISTHLKNDAELEEIELISAIQFPSFVDVVLRVTYFTQMSGIQKPTFTEASPVAINMKFYGEMQICFNHLC